MTEAFLGWPPILWTARALVFILLAGACAAAFLYVLRFFRWKAVVIMWNAGLPRIRRIGWKSAAGEIGAEIDQGQDEQFAALSRRVDEMAVTRTIDRETVDDILRYLLTNESQYEFFHRDPRPPPRALGGDAPAGGDQPGDPRGGEAPV